MIQSGNYGRLMEGGRKVKGKSNPKKPVDPRTLKRVGSVMASMPKKAKKK